MVKSCHGAAPSSSLCGLAWLLWLDPVFGVISRCLCVYTRIPIDEETCGVGRLLRLAVLKGLRRLLRPTDATNTTTPKRSAACGGPLPHFAAGLRSQTSSMPFGGRWRCDTKSESSFLEAHRARVWPRAMYTPSAEDASHGCRTLWRFRSFYSLHHRPPAVQLVRG